MVPDRKNVIFKVLSKPNKQGEQRFETHWWSTWGTPQVRKTITLGNVQWHKLYWEHKGRLVTVVNEIKERQNDRTKLQRRRGHVQDTGVQARRNKAGRQAHARRRA